ncbi:hypothetical protein GCM10010168_31610 [Actinoplanes ianthinogenes]|uniref:HTH tetR-type domain-containing protein n=1 Tax=Actinoplanes ianthinogenes TaxID=122358 RepID=A0ABM7LM68_9ACTN|nr:TetR family transcriptional regulator [Actinoplanes ianthinogenes]BCJ40302.1 hypothetical protein Aiant_09590 [Actinoplanes ianthinogenes]GGR11436.1 hypothetical protein GCM10010168_31610 [Actinoplanes ianthinogenes]
MGITNLRDRKREQNRIATVRAAWTLFIERGYDHVTVSDICLAADIAPRTFHRYFAGKEDVVAEPVRQMTTIVTEYVTGAAAGLSDREVLREAMVLVARYVVEHRDLLIALRTVAQQSTHLKASQTVVRTETEPDIAALLDARHPDGEPGQWRRRLLVGCTTAAFRVWYEDFLRGDLPDPMAHLAEVLDAAGT